MKNILSSLSVFGSYAAVAAFAVGGMANFSYQAHAAQGKACYEEFNAAKKSGTLKEKNFKEYKAAHCSEKSEAAAATAGNNAVKPATETPKKEEKPAVTAKKKEVAEKGPAITGDVVFPDKINPKFASEKEGTARMHTCQDQYNANKVSGKNGGLKWIQKGGGYYSECNKHLKSAAK